MAFCENCNIEHSGEWASGRFCSRSCSNSFSTKVCDKEERSKNLSLSLIGKPTGRKGNWTDAQRTKAALLKKERAELNWKTATWDNVPVSRYRQRILYDQGGCCNICNIPTIWNNQPLILQLDHISGNRKDNSRDNLRMICPNCHSQTHTFCSKNASVEGKLRMLEGAKKGGFKRKKVEFLIGD